MKTTIKRTQAADILDRIRVLLADGKPAMDIERELEKQFGIVPLSPCCGAAHENAFIDNCFVCAPRWGYIGPKIKIT